MSRSGESGFDLEVRAPTRRQRALGGDAAAGDEERARVAGRCSRRDDAALDGAQPCEPFELAADLLERLQAVAETGRIFVAPVGRELGEPPAQPRQRSGRTLELVGEQRARRELCTPARADRPERRRLRRRDDTVPALAQPDVAVGPRHARIRGRTQLPDQPQLLERCLELGAEHAPLDPLDGAERRFHLRPLPLGAEVRAQPRAQVARPPDVQHLLVAVAEEIDAGSRRCSEREVPLVEDASRTRRRERDEIGDGSCAALLREADQGEQHLRRCLRVGQSPVARLHRGAEEIGELPEARAGHTAGKQPPRERDRVDDRRREPRSRQALGLAVEEGEIEARVVRDEHGVSGEGQEVAHRRRCRRGTAELPVGQPGQRRDHGAERHVGVDERLELLDELVAAHLDGADLADLRRPWSKARRLEVDDDVGRVLE